MTPSHLDCICRILQLERTAQEGVGVQTRARDRSLGWSERAQVGDRYHIVAFGPLLGPGFQRWVSFLHRKCCK